MAPHPKKPELNLTRKERRQTMPNTMAEFKFTPTHQKNTKIHKNTPWANKTLNMLYVFLVSIFFNISLANMENGC